MTRRELHHGARIFHPSRPARQSERPSRPRSGLTLFEVVLALGIFMVSLAALGQLIGTGSRAAVRAQLQTEAVLRCQSKLAEVVAGSEPLASVVDAAFADDPQRWTWSLAVADAPVQDLLFLQLTVNYVGAGMGEGVSFTLDRYLRDPQVFLDAAAEEPVTAEEPL